MFSPDTVCNLLGPHVSDGSFNDIRFNVLSLFVPQTSSSLYAPTSAQTAGIRRSNTQRVRQNATEGTTHTPLHCFLPLTSVIWSCCGPQVAIGDNVICKGKKDSNLVLNSLLPAALDQSLRALLEVLLPTKRLGQFWRLFRGGAASDPEAVLGDLWVTRTQSNMSLQNSFCSFVVSIYNFWRFV